MTNKMKTVESIVTACDSELALVKHSGLIPVREKCIDYISISNCLNEELAEFGFKSFTSPDKGVILIDENTKSQILNVLDEETLTPYLSDLKVKRVSEEILFFIKTIRIPGRKSLSRPECTVGCICFCGNFREWRCCF